MRDVTHIQWIRLVDLFTFSHGGNWNKQGGRVTFLWLEALFVSEELLQVPAEETNNCMLDCLNGTQANKVLEDSTAAINLIPRPPCKLFTI